MKHKFLYLLCLFGTCCMAQNHFKLSEISEKYHVSIDIATCNEKECFGKASIILMDKNTSEKFPALISEDFTFNIKTDSSDVKNVQFEGTENPVIFNDFNFDGYEDVAIINRSSEDLQKFLYDVYIFDTIQKKFFINEGLTNLVKYNSVMFTADSERKRLIVHLKSGCCIHIIKEYNVFPERDPLKVYDFMEDTRDPETVITIKSEYFDYKWLSFQTV